MKNFKYIIALAAAFVGFTSCEDDKEPVYQEPTEFVLNTPAFANQLYVLENGGTVEITCSQPDYGYSAVTNYGVDVSLSEEFTTDENGKQNFYSISVGKSARMLIPDASLSTAICELKGIKDFASFPEEGLDPVPLYIRATANLTGVASSAIISNTICLQNVKAYNPYREGGRVIYWVGDVSGWVVDNDDATEKYADWVLTETELNSNIYVGAFDVPAGVKNFRFYTQLGNWNEGSVGSSTDGDINLPVEITDDAVTHDAVNGNGNWCTESTWEGGYITFTVDLNEYDINEPATSKPKVTMQAGNWDTSKLKFIYLVGDCAAWSVDAANAEEIYANYKLYDWEDNGVYSNTFNVAEGKATFRFYTELGAWDTGSLGYKVDDEATPLQMTDGAYAGSYVSGKGSWQFPDWAGGKMKMVVDTENHTVNFSAVE